jgi:ribosomal protein L7/L12
MRHYADQWLSWVGWALFVFSVLSVVLHPVAWWRYVVTGAVPPRTIDAKYTQPGTYQVQLVSAGERPIDVVEGLREVADLGLVEAKQRVDNPPAVIASELSPVSAAHVRDRIHNAGGTVSVSNVTSASD